MSEVKVPVGYKQTEVGIIPEDWSSIKVQDVCDFIVPGRNKPQKFDGDIPWITTPDLTDGRAVFFSRSGLKVSKEVAKNVGSKIVPAGSVIMSCVGELGLVAIAGVNIVINQQLHAFLPSKKIDNYFLMYALKDQESYFYGAATKTALPYLNKDNCNATPLPLPSIKEQAAIANALTDTDNLTQAIEKLIAKKEAIKTGTMQQLLTGKTRLPEFATREDGSAKGFKQTELGKIPEDWDVKNYEEIFTFLSTSSNSRADLSSNGDYGYIHYGDIHTKWNTRLDLSKTSLPKISAELVTSAFVQHGDIIIADASEDYEGVGKSIEILNTSATPVVSGLHTFLLRDRNQELSDGFRGLINDIPVVKTSIQRLRLS